MCVVLELLVNEIIFNSDLVCLCHAFVVEILWKQTREQIRRGSMADYLYGLYSISFLLKVKITYDTDDVPAATTFGGEIKAQPVV